MAGIGNKVDVSPFIPDYQAMEKVLIVNASVQYIFKYTGNVYMIVLTNALSVPSMENN